MTRHPLRRITASMAIIGVVLLSGIAPAGAHAGAQSYVYLDVGEDTLGGRLEVPIDDLASTLDLDLDGTDEETLGVLGDNEPAIDTYFEEHLKVGFDGVNKQIEFDTATLFYSELAENNDNYLVVDFTVDVAGQEVPRVLDVTFDPFFDEIEGRDALLLIGNDWKGGVIENSHEVFVGFAADNRTQAIDLGGTGWSKTFMASVKLGVDHIRTGPDHILFVLVLVLPSVLVFATIWRPAASFGSSLWRVSKVVTVFTLAHTITFSLAGLEILPLPPSKFVEADHRGVDCSRGAAQSPAGVHQPGVGHRVFVRAVPWNGFRVAGRRPRGVPWNTAVVIAREKCRDRGRTDRGRPDGLPGALPAAPDPLLPNALRFGLRCDDCDQSRLVRRAGIRSRPGNRREGRPDRAVAPDRLRAGDPHCARCPCSPSGKEPGSADCAVRCRPSGVDPTTGTRWRVTIAAGPWIGSSTAESPQLVQ